MSMVHMYAKEAERLGVIIRPHSCETCGDSDSRLVRHHRSYFDALEITWLCRSCHLLEHRANKSLKSPFWLRSLHCVKSRYPDRYAKAIKARNIMKRRVIRVMERAGFEMNGNPIMSMYRNSKPIYNELKGKKK